MPLGRKPCVAVIGCVTWRLGMLPKSCLAEKGKPVQYSELSEPVSDSLGIVL